MIAIIFTAVEALELERHFRREAIFHQSHGTIEGEWWATENANRFARALEFERETKGND